MKLPIGIQQVLTGIINKAARLVTPGNEGDQGPLRLGRRNEAYVQNIWNNLYALAEEGSLYVAQTPTPGTGVTLTSATGTTFSSTQGIFGVQNNDSQPSLGSIGRDHIPLWLKLIITAAGTAGTDDHYAGVMDKGMRLSAGTVNNLPSFNGTPLSVRNVNPSYPVGDDASQIFLGVPTIAAASQSAYYLGRAEGRKAAAPGYIVGDVVTFLFGCMEQVQAQAITPTTAIGLVLPMPAVIIPPGWSYALLEWMTARSAAQSVEMEYGYVLR